MVKDHDQNYLSKISLLVQLFETNPQFFCSTQYINNVCFIDWENASDDSVSEATLEKFYFLEDVQHSRNHNAFL